MKFNFRSLGLILVTVLSASSCSIHPKEIGFGNGTWGIPTKPRLSTHTDNVIILRDIHPEINVAEGEAVSLTLDSPSTERRLSFTQYTTINSSSIGAHPERMTSFKSAISSKSLQKKQIRALSIPTRRSPILKWVLFSLFCLTLTLGLIFSIYSFTPGLNWWDSGIFLSAGIILLIVSWLYHLGLNAFDNLSRRGIIFKIGMWTTLFGWITFYSLAVSLPLWILGAIFDI